MIFDMPSCGGCSTCEMACSFRHRGEFIPAISSIRILDRERGPGFFLCLLEEGDGKRIACDGCVDLDVPPCVQHCEKGEDLEKILKDFMATRKQKGRQGTGP